MSDHLGAWIVVGLLAVALVAVWGGPTPVGTHAGVDRQHCGDIAVAGASLPQVQTWRPNPVLAGMPVASPTPVSSYELAEERSIARLEQTGGGASATVVGHYGSSTSLKPIRMC